jgi:hypothetical protein
MNSAFVKPFHFLGYFLTSWSWKMAWRDSRRSRAKLGVPTQFGRVLLAYPLWVRALSTRAAMINAELEGLFFPWGSSIALDSAPPGTAVPLFTTSRAGGVDREFAMIEPRREFRRDSLAPRVVAALVNPLAADSATDVPAGRVVVVGSADVAADRFLRNAPENLDFLLNAVDWLAQDEGLITIRAKNRAPPPLAFTSAVARGAARYGNLIGVPLLIIAFAAVRLWRRRALAGLPYVPGAQGTAA